MSKKIDKQAKNVVKRKTGLTVLRILLIVIIIFLINVYVILAIMYKGENFTIALADENESGLVIFDDSVNKNPRTYLKSEDIKSFSDISINWLPKDIDNEGDGSHNGSNYIAYTFYVQNQSEKITNYWTTIEIDDVIKNVDEAVRIMVIKNGERTVYAKNNLTTGNPEDDTTPFNSDKVAMLENNKEFQPDQIDKYTIVIWIEGNDPECVDNIIGGEIKMHMTITEEHVTKE